MLNWLENLWCSSLKGMPSLKSLCAKRIHFILLKDACDWESDAIGFGTIYGQLPLDDVVCGDMCNVYKIGKIWHFCEGLRKQPETMIHKNVIVQVPSGTDFNQRIKALNLAPLLEQYLTLPQEIENVRCWNTENYPVTGEEIVVIYWETYDDACRKDRGGQEYWSCQGRYMCTFGGPHFKICWKKYTTLDIPVKDWVDTGEQSGE